MKRIIDIAKINEPTHNKNNSNLLSTKVTGYDIKFKICNSDFCPFYDTNCKMKVC